MVEKIYPQEWSVHEGYQDFVAKARPEIDTMYHEVIASLGPTLIRQSLQHPNGFLVNTLENSLEGQTRLHIWPTGLTTDTTPHSHPWHMVSMVLAGVYSEYIPNVRLDDSGSNQLVVSYFNKDRQQVGSKPSGRRVSYSLGELSDYRAGQYHVLPAGAFHATPLPQVEPIVTLVRTSPQLYENPSFVENNLNRQLKIATAADRQPPPERQVQAIWRMVALLLENQR